MERVDLIRQQRRRLHELTRDEAIAIIERSLGRRVRAFLGDIAADEGVAVAVFLLEPSAETAHVTVDGERDGSRDGDGSHDGDGAREGDRVQIDDAIRRAPRAQQ